MSERPGTMNDDHRQVERLLREQASEAMVSAPETLRAGVLARLAEAKRPATWGRLPVVVGVIGSLAAAVVLAWVLRPLPTPARTQQLAFDLPLGPRPIILPAGRFVAGSIDRPLMGEATQLVNDTRRATRFVVDCLPFTSGGG